MAAPSEGGWGSYLREGQGRERGARRQKLAGYLKAANELRQSYSKSITQRGNTEPVEWVMTGEEQLILFPSYAKWKPPRRRLTNPPAPQSELAHADYGFETVDDGQDGIIDVDVRGWVFKPQSGPLTRKNKILMGIARHLCGLPPLSTENEPDAPTEEEIINESKKLTLSAGTSGLNTPPGSSTPPTQGNGWSVASKPVLRQATNALSAWRNPYATNNGPAIPQEQVTEEHAELLARLAPFMHQPLPNQEISVFMYNAETSTSRRIQTCERGHFSLRASVDFIPTDIRVIVSEKLSLSEPVKLLEKYGMSLISDIDDTIKHSAVHQGTREMFRNTFIKPLQGLVIEGVKEWYNALASPPYNVQIHYVSNSPWQLYPLLESYLKMTGMPPGSFHLKQYSGMLKGIFEPVSERKKASLERLIRDFPDRKWIFVGDSGEMDLEVYCEIALTFPGRVKGIFIRDVLAVHSSKLHEAAKGEELNPANKTFFTNSYSEPALNSSGVPLPPQRTFTTNFEKDMRKPPPLPPKPKDLQSPPLPPKPKNLQSQPLKSNNPYAALQGLPGSYPISRTNREFQQPSASSYTEPPIQPGQATYSLPQTAADRKFDVWNRRWEYAKAAMDREGIVLRSWRVGTDVKDECLEIVKRELERR